MRLICWAADTAVNGLGIDRDVQQHTLSGLLHLQALGSRHSNFACAGRGMQAGLEDAAGAQGSFSLFHHSPASPRRRIRAAGAATGHGLQQSNAQELRAYQLFGASQGPLSLAPLLRVPF